MILNPSNKGTKLPKTVQDQFILLLNNNCSIEEFENWLYSQPTLEELLGENLYLEVISLDFKNNSAKYELEKLLNTFIDYAQLEEARLREVLNSLIVHDEHFQKNLYETYEIYCKGYSFFQSLGLVYGLYLICDDDKVLHEKDYEAIKHSSVKILNWLDTKQIILTGECDQMDHYSYIDNREEADKEAVANYPAPTHKKTNIILYCLLITFVICLLLLIRMSMKN